MLLRMSGPNPRLLARLAAQHNVVRPKQAIDDGHTEDEFYGMVRGGRFDPLHYGVYRLSGSRRTPEQAAMAAALRCWPRATISGRFVLGLFGVEGSSRFDPFVILVPPPRRISNIGFPVVRDHAFDHDRATMDGLPIVTMGRALFDAAEDLDDRAILTSIDSGRWLGLLTDQKLDSLLDRCAWHPQAPRIQRLVDAGLVEQESHGERAFVGIFLPDDPPLEYQVWITPQIRVDGLWRDAWMVLEYLGKKDHASGWRREGDADRDEVIRGHGYHVEYVTSEDLEHPGATRARLLAVRRALLAARPHS